MYVIFYRYHLNLGQPFDDVNIPKETDPYKTIFVGRLAFTTTEERLRKEFEFCGTVDRVRLVKNLQGKSKGYGFVTFKHQSDAEYAFQKADGRRVEGKRILVDRELGRTKKSWLPRRLGGGKGGETRKADTDLIVEEVQRELKRERDLELEERRKEEMHSNPNLEQQTLIETKTEPAQNMQDEREPGEL